MIDPNDVHTMIIAGIVIGFLAGLGVGFVVAYLVT